MAMQMSLQVHQLPPEIAIDILSRLPIKSIFNCRRVCKAWLHLISHPLFVELQLARSPISFLIKSITSVNKSRKISLTHVEECEDARFLVDRIKFSTKANLPSSKFRLVNSCKEQHKVLQAFYPKIESPSRNKCLEAEIYTIGTGAWRSIQNAPDTLVELPFNALLHGALHWVPIYYDSEEFIYYFNFESEQFGVVPPPSDFGPFELLNLGVLGGCLFLCVFGDDYSKFDTWVMKDYGMQESWTKQFVIENLYLRECSCDKYESVKFLNNGEILMVYNDRKAVCYNTKLQTLCATSITRTRYEFNAIAFTPSFVSLYSIAKEEHVERVQGRKEYYTVSAEGFLDCAGGGMLVDSLGSSNSTFYQGHPGGTVHLQDPDDTTEFASAVCSGHFGSTPTTNCFVNGVSINVETK
ncbi:F-box protein [Quillaja saponaria]|uniref:F-box protein n=1 Tax=Quillaja saponaria TaxID=32244 RepID=A0AAD7QEW7_QUISA|nr:F-box protein [Quillaja saponaria]